MFLTNLRPVAVKGMRHPRDLITVGVPPGHRLHIDDANKGLGAKAGHIIPQYLGPHRPTDSHHFGNAQRSQQIAERGAAIPQTITRLAFFRIPMPREVPDQDLKSVAQALLSFEKAMAHGPAMIEDKRRANPCQTMEDFHARHLNAGSALPTPKKICLVRHLPA